MCALCVIQISGVPATCRGGGGDYHFYEKKSVIILESGKILSDNPGLSLLPPGIFFCDISRVGAFDL